MKLIEVTNPNFVVNKEFKVKFEDNSEVTYYEDDYIDLKVSKGQLIINDKYVTTAPDNIDEFVEPVEAEYKLTESSIDTSSLRPISLILPQ